MNARGARSRIVASPIMRPFSHGERSVFGSRGPRLDRWQVVANVDTQALREEIAR